MSFVSKDATYQIRLPERLAHSVQLVGGGSCDDKVLGKVDASNQVVRANEWSVVLVQSRNQWLHKPGAESTSSRIADAQMNTSTIAHSEASLGINWSSSEMYSIPSFIKGRGYQMGQGPGLDLAFFLEFVHVDLEPELF